MPQLMGVLSLLLMISSMVFIDESTVFPGVMALWPCLGTAIFLCLSSANSLVNWCIAWNPFTLIGALSYSIYLFHWPIVTWYEALDLPLNVPRHMLAASALIFSISIISFRFVESPLRRVSWSPRRTILVLFVLPCILLLLLGMGGVMALSQNQNQQQQQQPIMAANGQKKIAPGCRLIPEGNESLINAVAACKPYIFNEWKYPVVNTQVSGKNAPIEALFFGDSHSGAIWGIVAQFFKAQKVNFYFHGMDSYLSDFVNQFSCPKDGTPQYKPNRNKKCTSQDQSYNTLECTSELIYRHSKLVSLIVFTSRFSYYTASLLPKIECMVRYFAATKRIVIIGEAPLMAPPMGKCPMLETKIKDQKSDCLKRYSINSHSDFKPVPTQQPLHWQQLAYYRFPFLNRQLQQMALSQKNVSYWSFWRDLCPRGSCGAYYDGFLVYKDANHISLRGALYLGYSIVKERNVPVEFQVT